MKTCRNWPGENGRMHVPGRGQGGGAKTQYCKVRPVQVSAKSWMMLEHKVQCGAAGMRPYTEQDPGGPAFPN